MPALQSAPLFLLCLLVAAQAAAGPPLDAPAQPTFPAPPRGKAAYAPDRLIVKFKPRAGAKAAARPTVVRLKAGADAAAAAAAYRQRPDVEYAVPDEILRPHLDPNDVKFPAAWGLKRVRAPFAWNSTTGSSAVTVCIVDSGIDYTHPDLAPNMHPERGWNAIVDSNDPLDDLNHGTHVAGIVGAVGNNQMAAMGVNWQVSLLACKFISASGDGFSSNAIRCIDYCVSKGAKIIQASWGGATSANPAMLEALQRAEAAGVLFVNSAGNSNVDVQSSPTYPASYALPNMLVVASVGSTDALSTFSNFGPSIVHLAAPGEWIMSTVPGNATGYMSGTSMAAPFVSGAAALLLAASEGNLTVAQLRQLLTDSADRLEGLDGKVASGGRLNVEAAVELCLGRTSDSQAPASPSPSPSPSPLPSPSPSPSPPPSPGQRVIVPPTGACKKHTQKRCTLKCRKEEGKRVCRWVPKSKQRAKLGGGAGTTEGAASTGAAGPQLAARRLLRGSAGSND